MSVTCFVQVLQLLATAGYEAFGRLNKDYIVFLKRDTVFFLKIRELLQSSWVIFTQGRKYQQQIIYVVH